ncbi:ATP-dependent endonuclease [Ectopseudomonas oleovorans]|uniref:AAA ATPase-like protein n=1 Tax=Ectopseudomonas oleovorans TaxID=301 RepID=A0A3D9EDT7_ECTOL|nr:AAA family ATPase [Pseudomonas oleovorans]RED01283.1 AAA ATPase-like protein [Pseudomonas oleovorans]
MKYRESNKDRELRSWFSNDYTKSFLRRIVLVEGSLRGVNSLDISLSYPITAFAGVNGSGKSTILAMACCAYHASSGGFKLPKRRRSYFTFSDFFIQHVDEVPPEGIEIKYTVAYNNWKPNPNVPQGIGLGVQVRKKKKGGKWNDYAIRIKKCVVFLGIERIVPHIERSQSRSYLRAFADVKPKGWEGKVKDAVGYILGKNYEDFRYLEYSKYSLPVVKVDGITYSGFNMGAGENALFEIFHAIYACGGNSLLVMDEIELGLHAKAQKRLMEKLKEVCKSSSTQIICTTHSKEVFESLPDDARFYVENIAGKTKITAGISSDFAFSKMGAKNQIELFVFVEDEVAKAVINSILPAAIRCRVQVSVIGSAAAIARQLAAHYARGDERSIVAIFDGDQKIRELENIKHAKSMAENNEPEFEEWLKSCISYLPGDTWPEAMIVQKCKQIPAEISKVLALESADEADALLEAGLQAGKHKEFYEVGVGVGLDKVICMNKLVDVFASNFNAELEYLLLFLKDKLD